MYKTKWHLQQVSQCLGNDSTLKSSGNNCYRHVSRIVLSAFFDFLNLQRIRFYHFTATTTFVKITLNLAKRPFKPIFNQIQFCQVK